MIYLRSRMYSPETGRFTTKDSWLGDYNSPLSLNKWNYATSNPILYTDPTGNKRAHDNPSHDRCAAKDKFDYVTRTDFAERLVDRDVEGHILRSYLNTYTAAGIGVQCYASAPNKPWDWNNSGEGPGQISNNQKSTPYGHEVGDDRGDGLRCYITHGYDCACLDKKNIPDDYKLEPEHNQNDNTWAVVYMSRRIKLVTDKCEEAGCTSTDIFIAAALAQNGPGFTKRNIQDLTLPKLRVNEEDVTIDWKGYFGLRNNADDTSDQLILFTGVIKELERRGWYLPYVNWNTVDKLTKIGD